MFVGPGASSKTWNRKTLLGRMRLKPNPTKHFPAARPLSPDDR